MGILGTRKALGFGVRLLFVILSVPILSLAANHYVRAGASGNGSGSDWANAYTNLPSSLVRGDTYYMAAGSYGAHTLKDPVSGTAMITIKTATKGDHGTSTGWSDSYAGQVVFKPFTIRSGYYTIDGQYRASRSSGYGMKVLPWTTCSGNCPSFWLQGGYTVDHFTVQYVDMPGYGQNNQTVEYQYGVYAVPGIGGSGGSYSNITISHDYIHDQGVGGVPILTGSVNGLTVEYCDIARNTYTNAQHTNGWSDRGSDNVTFRYNWFEDIQATSVITSLNSGTTTTSTNWYIYGNVFWENHYNNNGVGQASISCINGNTCSNVYIYNNSFINFTGASLTGRIDWTQSSSSSTNIVVENNIWYNSVHVAPSGPITSKYNYYINCTEVPSETAMQTGSSNIFRDLAGGDFHLIKETNDGIHLPSPYDHDPDGVTRGSNNGVWSRGAYQFVSGSSSTPAPPSNLAVKSVQ